MHVAHPKRSRLIIFSVFFITVCFVSLFLRMLFSPLQKVGKHSEYILMPGTTSSMMLDDLRKKHMINAEQMFFLKVYLKTISVDNKIRAGKYHIDHRTTPYALVQKLVRGEVEPSFFRIQEGQTFAQVLSALSKHPEVKHTLKGMSASEVMYKVTSSKMHYEGWFFPDTYQFHFGTRDVEILRYAYDNMQQKLALAWNQRNQFNALKDPYEVLILASIIEKEAGVLDDRAQISGVFQRRLSKKIRLQADPTVIYGLGERFDGNLRKTDLKTDTPYNTYIRFGLPPTPIALPSMASLMAAAQPFNDDTLYFVSKGDGSHHFSTTLKEHNLAVQKYQIKSDKKDEKR